MRCLLWLLFTLPLYATDLSDLALMGQCWEKPRCFECVEADYSGNGIVDLTDLMIFTERWLEVSLPNKIIVSGITNPTAANGTYTLCGSTYVLNTDMNYSIYFANGIWGLSHSEDGLIFIGATNNPDVVPSVFNPSILGSSDPAAVVEYAIAAPVISYVTDNGSGQVTAAVTGTGTITLYYRQSGIATWTTGNNRSGSGNIVQTGITGYGTYEFYCVASDSGYYSAPSGISTLVKDVQSMLTTLAKYKTYTGMTSSDDDALLVQIIGAATSEIQRFCQRDFVATTYREFYDGDGTSEINLKHYPITEVKMLGVGREDAFQIINTSSDAYHAAVSVTDTTLHLVVQGGVNEHDTSLTLASYTTLTSLIAAISALSKGWAVITPAEAVAVWSPSELLPTGKGLRCLNGYAAIQIPYEPEEDFTTDTTAGIIKLFGRFCDGTQNIIIRYTSGYATIPADLEQICIELVDNYYDKRAINPTLQSERLGDYQYTNKSESNQTGSTIPAGLQARLEKWRSRRAC